MSSHHRTAWKWTREETFGRRASRSSTAIASAWQSRSAGSRCGSLARRRQRASELQQNSAGRCSSPTSFAISPKMRSDNRLYLPRELLHAHGILATMPSWCWHSRRFPMSAVIWLCLLEQHYAAAAEAIAACPRWTIAPGGRDARHLSRPSPQASRARWRQLDEPIRMACLAQPGPRDSSWLTGR